MVLVHTAVTGKLKCLPVKYVGDLSRDLQACQCPCDQHDSPLPCIQQMGFIVVQIYYVSFIYALDRPREIRFSWAA